jgi:PQ loop repeat
LPSICILSYFPAFYNAYMVFYCMVFLDNSAFEAFVTLFLLTYHSSAQQIQLWATFLGVTSAVLAVIQYLPQLIKTYRMKLVGAISIPMMCIQSPGSILMVLSIALR